MFEVFELMRMKFNKLTDNSCEMKQTIRRANRCFPILNNEQDWYAVMYQPFFYTR